MSSPTRRARDALSRIGIRTQLIGVLLVSLLPMVALATYQIYDEVTEARSSVEQVATSIAQINAAEIGRFLKRTETLLAGLAQDPDVVALDPARCGRWFDHFTQLSPYHANLLTKDALGHPICSGVPIPPGSNLTLGYSGDIAGHDGLTIGRPHRGPLSNRWLIPLSYPLRNDRGEVIGAIAAPLDLLNFNPFFGAHDGLPEGATATLFDADMTLLARSAASDKWVGVNRSENTELVKLVAKRSGTRRFSSMIDHVERIHAAAPVPGTTWTSVASIPAAALDALETAAIRKWLTIGALALLASLGLAWELARRTATPILAVAAIAEQVGRGETGARAVPAGSGEVVAFATAFNGMLDNLRQKQLDIVASEERYHSLFSRSKVAMLLVDPAGGAIVDANEAAVQFYGWSLPCLKAMRMADINVLRPDEIACELVNAHEQRRNHFFFRHRLISGEVRDVEVHSGPLSIGGRSLLFSIVHDVTDRKQAEEKIVQLLAYHQAVLSNGDVPADVENVR